MARGIGPLSNRILRVLCDLDLPRGVGVAGGGDGWKEAAYIDEMIWLAQAGYPEPPSSPEEAPEETIRRPLNTQRSQRAKIRRALLHLETLGLVDTQPTVKARKGSAGGGQMYREMLEARVTAEGRKAHVDPERLANARSRPQPSDRSPSSAPASAPIPAPLRPPAATPDPVAATVERDDDNAASAFDMDAVIALLTAEGFETTRVGAVLRAWHRQEQAANRTCYGNNGPPLHEYTLFAADVDTLRVRLSD